VTVHQWLHHHTWLAAAVAVATAIAAMHATKTLHPPGGATSLCPCACCTWSHDHARRCPVGKQFTQEPQIPGVLALSLHRVRPRRYKTLSVRHQCPAPDRYLEERCDHNTAVIVSTFFPSG
jgi:CBS-domain-containing membrane protein